MHVFPSDDRGEVLLTYVLDDVERTSPGMSASQRLSSAQRKVLLGAAGVLVVALVLWPGVVVATVATCFSLLYLATVAHRVVLFRRSLRVDVVHHVDDASAMSFPIDRLPTYTVLVPAYGEPEVVPDLIAALERLEYPRDRLEVKLLLEEEDDETLAAALAVSTDLPLSVLVVPKGKPRTKPRALDYGLACSRGDLVTVYDAEDRPEPLQLLRAAVTFAGLGPEWACLQARLDFYESTRNLLTRWFSAEYGTWFACYLPGLAAGGGVVPLGGTSNHFRRSALVDVGAWDPFNVTEDADLGIRLQRRGYRVGVLDSVTLEEPNADIVNWVKQRSRWHKGYLQTALVHLRQPRRLVRELGWRGALDVVLFVLGTPLLALANPAFWALALVWVIAQPAFVHAVFPGIAFHLAAFVWAVGNFAVLYLTVSTLVVIRRDDLLPACLLVPLYWVLMSIAALRALAQLVTDPYHWEKTVHGLGPARGPCQRPHPYAASVNLDDLGLFAFDVAGTTVRDDGQVLAAFLVVAGESGLDVDAEWLRARMGWRKRTVFEAALELQGRPAADGAELAARLEEVFAASLRDSPPRALPGAVEAMQALREAGVLVGFTTGFSVATVDLVLGALGWAYDVRVASDEVAAGRPAPDLILEAMRRVGVTDAYRVGACGDTPADLAAATAAGCRIVAGVGHGTHSLAELAAAPHTLLLPDLTGLVEAIRAA